MSTAKTNSLYKANINIDFVIVGSATKETLIRKIDDEWEDADSASTA